VYDDDVRFGAGLIFFFPSFLSYASVLALPMEKNTAALELIFFFHIQSLFYLEKSL
jgi:hypothetical protein